MIILNIIYKITYRLKHLIILQYQNYIYTITQYNWDSKIIYPIIIINSFSNNFSNILIFSYIQMNKNLRIMNQHNNK